MVLDQPSKGPRLWTRRLEIDRWRGSPGDLLAAALAAREEIVNLGLKIGMIESVTVSYADDSEQAFGSIEAWKDDASLQAPREIRSLEISLDANSAKVSMAGDPGKGLVVVAEGSETFANGIRATMKARLSGGGDAGIKSARSVPGPKWMRLAVPLALLPAIGVGWLIHSVETYEPSVVMPLVLGSLSYVVFLIPILGGAATEREKHLPPRFQLVHEGDQFPDEKDEAAGPAWRIKRWLERHFVIGIFLNWLGAGVVGALIALLATKAI
jgi:hypothetical protein